MKKANVALLGVLIIVLCLPPGIYAQIDEQDDGDNRTVTMLATRSSPFNPPTKDVFVADDGSGLDTGCTFNNDPNHPLMIDIVVDQFVGAVDGNGFLANPAPLIAKGIIPTAIEVIMPAFDVDVNGSPPPERDEVLFNGQNLGFLNGDNDIWLLNSFTVDISQVKFPAATGGSATNRVQINVDTLSSGRWCTAIDWVALVIPIRPKIALTLTVMGGNKVLEIADDIIYKQSFDADCNVTTDIGPVDDFPFAGSSNKEVTLRTKIAFCPNTGKDPNVKAMWTVDGPVPLQTRGTSTWTGFEGDVKLKMLDRVTVGSANIDYEIDNQTTSVTRKVFVTKNNPLASVSPPKKAWYEKAVLWGKGSGPGESNEAKILENILAGEYAFGNSNWRYGYNFGSVSRCPWQDLVNDPITCNYSDCYVFSDVFENMAAVLGIGGMTAIQVLGTNSQGFVTNGSPSIDPAFRGNSRPFAGGAFDRYLFSSHSLRLKGKYHDATFNGLYSSPTQFISWNLTGGMGVDADGAHFTTNEGAKVYPLSGSAYDSWGASRYKTPGMPLSNLSSMVAEQPLGPQARLSGIETMSVQNLQFTGNNTFTPVDANGDGIFEALRVNVEAQTSTAGEYTIFGVVQKGSTIIANRPSFESMLFTSATFTSAASTHNVDLTFSGEQIFRSGQDGPYDLVLFSIGPNNESAQATFPTPAIDHTQYGEVQAVLTGTTDSAIDSDNDGDFDFVKVAVAITVRTSGDFSLQGDLSKNNVSIVGAGSAFNLGVGTHTVELQFPGSELRRSGQNGPYTGSVTLLDATSHSLQSFSFTTQPYTSSSFGALLNLDGSFNDQGIDTNGNGLFDLLRIDFGADVQLAGSYLVSGQLTGPGGEFVAFTDLPMSLDAGQQTITLDFLGPVIHEQGIDGPYEVEIVIRNETSFDELDRIKVGTTQGFSHTDFDPFEVADIELTGNSNDFGVDTNSNGLFDELHVEVEVALTTSDFYQWSARLVDVNGTEIDFDSRSGSLNAGRATINFIFDGQKIGANGVNGPYFLKGLLMFGQSGPNVVLVDVAETQAYNAAQFEGFVPILPADLSLTKTDNPDHVIVGQNLTYSLAVTNNGPSDATGVILTDTLPTGVTFVSATPSQGDCTEASGTITCNLGDLANGATATVTIVVTPTGGCSIINAANVTANESDPDDTNNTASASTAVFLDDFNRSNGKLGNNWLGKTSGYRIVNNTVDVKGGGPIFWKPQSFAADQEACITLVKVDPRGARQGLLLKVQKPRSDDWGGRAISVFYNAKTGKVGVATFVRKHGWKLQMEFPASLADGDQLSARALADGTVRVYVNGVEIGNTNVGSSFVNKGGYLGLWFNKASKGVVDNFGGGTITP